MLLSLLSILVFVPTLTAAVPFGEVHPLEVAQHAAQLLADRLPLKIVVSRLMFIRFAHSSCLCLSIC